MPTANLGRVRPVPKGAWSSGTAYSILDIVTTAVGSYIALQDVPAATLTTNTTFWQQLALNGTPGAPGTPGMPGADGKTILNGSGAPGAGLGVDGDFYIDTAADAIYGPKAAGVWGSATSLVGTPGADGKTVLNGSGAPGAGLGVDGDFYIDTAADAIYGPKAAGVWGSATSLAGSAGVGMPAGGTAGQIPVKVDATDYNISWQSVFRGLSLSFKPPATTYFSIATAGIALGTIAQVANRNTIAMFCPAFDVTIDQVGISVSTAVAASTAKVVIYASDATGLPAAVIAESATIDCSTTGTKTVSLSATFQAGKIYWVGVRANSTQTLRSLPAGGLPMLAMNNAATPAVITTLVKTETYTTAAAAWGFSTAQYSILAYPLVLMRAV